MDEQEIQARLDGLMKAMGAKDCVCPRAELDRKGLEKGNVYVAHTAAGTNNYKFFYVDQDKSAFDAFTAADAWVAAIKDKATRESESFIAQLGRLIDNGRDVGIKVEVLNPLTAMMEKLSTNIIEGPRATELEGDAE